MRKRLRKRATVTSLDSKRKARDVNQLAAAAIQRTVELSEDTGERQKNPAAVALGKLGGAKGGKARAANMTPEERRTSALKAVRARWAKSPKPT
jgi:hypothetical protein